MTSKLFSELGLSAELLKAIDKLGFEQASPIQAEAIPVLMLGRDVVGQSQTGSGKTAAFAVPAIEKVDPQQRAVQVLILCPTRELAVQVSEDVHQLALFKRGVTALPIYGGQSYERQFYGLQQGAQIVIGTPGRLMDHMKRGTLRLDRVKMVILDEADIMLDMGFREDIEFILQAVPATRQTVFFCATMPHAILELIRKYSRDPQQVRIDQKTLTVPTVEQVYYEVDRRFKIELLTRLIDIHDLKLGIIFCNTKRMVDDLVDHLEAQGYSADRLHGDMSQAMRDRVMNKFRKSGLEFLVATDVAARGIDVDDVQVVFNYDLPYDVEDYVHRIGRTGRAGRSGRAISFVAGRELFQIHNIERFIKMKIPRAKVPTPDEVEDARANAFLDKLRATLESGEFQRQDRLIEHLLEEGFSSIDIASALIHHLQAGETTSPARSPRPAAHARPERIPARETRDPRSDERLARQSRRHDERFADRPPRPSSERGSPEPLRPGKFAAPVVAGGRAPVPKRPAPPVAPVPPPMAPAPQHSTPPPAALPSAERPDIPFKADRKKDPGAAGVAAPKLSMLSPPEPVREEVKRLLRAPDRQPPVEPESASRPKPSHGTPDDQTRLYMNVGEEMGIGPDDVVGAIQGETGLPAQVVGAVDVRERHLFVDVASEHANAILAKLKRAQIKGHKLKVKVA